MSLSKKGKRGIAVIASIITLGLLVVFWGPISAKFSFLSKDVGEVQELEQSDYEVDEVINSEVLETVDYNLPEEPLPSDRRVTRVRYELKHCGIMWNATSVLAGGNGGAITKQGSFFDRLSKEYGETFSLKMTRQDDYSIQQDNLVEFAQAYIKSGGKETDKGCAFVTYMGDNAEVYMSQANAKLDAIAPDLGLEPGDLRAEGFLISGYSYGEDKAMGPVEWSNEFGDPTLALGEVFACYPQDGDQNLIVKWATDNGLLINPDGETYCREAVNFHFVDGFMEAAAAWGTYTGERIVVKIDPETGRTIKASERHSHVIHGVGTWTPGDEKAFNIASSQGYDLVSLYDTKDNAHQMPCLVVTLNKFIEDHPKIIDAMVEGTTRFGDQMKAHRASFDYGMQAMAEVFSENPASYWSRYFHGVKKTTPNGHEVILGGTRACNLADNMDALGVGENPRRTFQSSYELFGGYMHKLYPDYMPERLPYYQAINTAPLERVAAKLRASNEITFADKPEFDSGAIKEEVSKRSYSVEFATGSAKLTSKGIQALENMYQDLNTHDLRITVGGHTDNTGSDQVNIPLSKQRAESVVDWLRNRNQASFPISRFAEIDGFGSDRPLKGYDPNSFEGRAKNRRVEITVGY